MAVAIRGLGFLLLVAFIAGCGSEPTDIAPSDLASENEVNEPAEQTGDASPATDEHTGDAVDSEPTVAEPGVADEGTEPAAVPTTPADPMVELPAEDQWQAWSDGLRSDAPQMRSDATDSIAEALAPLESSQRWQLLENDSMAIRQGVAFYLLSRFGMNDQAAIAAWSEALDDDDATVRHIALSAIKRLPTASAAAATPQLVAMLGSGREDAANRAAIVRLLGKFDNPSLDASAALIQILHSDPDASVRAAAAAAIPNILTPEQAATELTTALAKAAGTPVEKVAIVQLGKLGAEAAPAATEIAKRLSNEDPALQRRAVEALIAIGKPAVPQLIAELKSPDSKVRQLAIFALGQFGSDAAEAIEPLKACTTDTDPAVQQLAKAAIRAIQTGP